MLLGSLWTNSKGRERFIVRTVLEYGGKRQRDPARQFVPIAVRLFYVISIGCTKEKLAVVDLKIKRPFAYSVVMNDVTKQVTPTLASAVLAAAEISPQPSEGVEIVAWFGDGTSRNMPFESMVTADRLAWISADDARRLEKTIFAPEPTVRLAEVEENLRGVPVEEAGLQKWEVEDYENLPDTIEFVDGLPSPKHWNIAMEGRRRLGWNNYSEEFSFFQGKTGAEVETEYARRRAELRTRPFVPSPVPFPSGREDE
jgi:hypothetical protein